jgi:hypothetical protein
VDGQSVAEFEKNLKGNLYKIWNRMSSGSYFPPPVRAWRSRRRTGRAPEFWACRRRRHTDGSPSDDLGFVVFHASVPRVESGQRLEVLFVKRRGPDTVFVCSGGVSGQTLPRPRTDRGESPLAHRLSAVGLAELAAVTRALRGR